MVKGVKFLSRLLSASGPSIFLTSSQTAPRPLSSFDTQARWQPVTHRARSRWSKGKIEDCEQSSTKVAFCIPSIDSSPFPLPSLRPLPIYLPPLPAPLPSCYLTIYLPLPSYLPIYLPLSRLPFPQPAPGLVYQLPLSILFSRPFFLPHLALSPPRSKPRFFLFFPFLC